MKLSHRIAFSVVIWMALLWILPPASAQMRQPTEQEMREEQARAQDAYFARRARERADTEALMTYGAIAAGSAILGLLLLRRARSKRRSLQAPGATPVAPPAPPSPPVAHLASAETAGAAATYAPVAADSRAAVRASLRNPAPAPEITTLLAQGKALYQLRQYADAQRLLEQAVAAAPANEEARYYLGLIALNRNDRSEAARRLGETIALAPAHFDAHFYLAETLLGQGDRNGAAAHYTAVVELRPDHEPARQRLQTLGVTTPSLHKPPAAALPVVGMAAAVPAPTVPDVGDDEPYLGDVYDSLRASKDEFSRMAVAMIAETRIPPRRPIMRAYRGEFLALFAKVAAVFVAGLIAVNLGGSLARRATQLYFQAKGSPASPGGMATPNEVKGLDMALSGSLGVANLVENAGIVLLLLSLVGFVYYLYYRHRRGQTVMSIGRGLIAHEGGIFTSQKQIHEIYRVSEFIAHQDFFNRVTGDGSLRLVFTMPPQTVDLRGLARYDELQVLAAKLRSLHLQLRSTNIGKGIMQ